MDFEPRGAVALDLSTCVAHPFCEVAAFVDAALVLIVDEHIDVTLIPPRALRVPRDDASDPTKVSTVQGVASAGWRYALRALPRISYGREQGDRTRAFQAATNTPSGIPSVAILQRQLPGALRGGRLEVDLGDDPNLVLERAVEWLGVRLHGAQPW